MKSYADELYDMLEFLIPGKTQSIREAIQTITHVEIMRFVEIAGLIYDLRKEIRALREEIERLKGEVTELKHKNGMA
jgi:polyhydroxyalkanoate synthesis regulator phasin